MIEEVFRPRYYEMGADGSISINMLCNYFQEAAGRDAHNMSFGWEDGIAWILTRMQMEVVSKASASDVITVKTWHSLAEKISSRRDFIITNQDGKVIMKGATWWIILNLATRRISRIPQTLLELNLAVPDFVVEEGDFKYKLEEGAPVVNSKEIIVRMEDIDTNNHVNNTHYISWAIESTPAEVRAAKTLKEIKVSFKAECVEGEKLTAKVYEAPGGVFVHELIKHSDGKEAARVLTHWI